MGLFKDFKAFRTLKDKEQVIAEAERKIKEQEDIAKNLKNSIETLKIAKEEAEQNRAAAVKETEEQCKKKIDDYKEETQKAKSDLEEAKGEFSAAENDHKSKLNEYEEERKEKEKELNLLQFQIKTIKSLIRGFKKTYSSGDDVETINEAGLASPSVELHLHSYDMKSLHKMAKDNEKLIDDVVGKYMSRYTTKTNSALYQLMVLAMRAELQNVMVFMKYSTLDKSLSKLDEMIKKYLEIATDGNQSIAPTLNRFINEIEVLFHKQVEIEYEYFVKKEQEKAEQQALKEQMRQEAEERKALERERAKVEAEEEKYNNEIQNVQEQLKGCTDDGLVKQLMAKIAELDDKLKKVEEKKEEIINLQNGKAGYVYIISNLGSFGENTFKIGMTRRQEPMDRVKELGDASVPFAFDVHSFIFSDDAVTLEHNLHTILDKKRKNKINLRKEFFDISIDGLEELVHRIDVTAEFNKTMVATEYRQSLAMDE